MRRRFVAGCPPGATVIGPPQIGISREQRLAELGRDLLSAAYLQGDFVLSSGVTSQWRPAGRLTISVSWSLSL